MRWTAVLLLVVLVAGCGRGIPAAQVAPARTPDDLDVREQAFRNAAESFLKSVEINAKPFDSKVSSSLYLELSTRYQREVDNLPDARHSKPLNLSLESIKLIPRDFSNAARYLDLADSFSVSEPDKSAECITKVRAVLDLIADNIRNARSALEIKDH